MSKFLSYEGLKYALSQLYGKLKEHAANTYIAKRNLTDIKTGANALADVIGVLDAGKNKTVVKYVEDYVGEQIGGIEHPQLLGFARVTTGSGDADTRKGEIATAVGASSTDVATEPEANKTYIAVALGTDASKTVKFFEDVDKDTDTKVLAFVRIAGTDLSNDDEGNRKNVVKTAIANANQAVLQDLSVDRITTAPAKDQSIVVMVVGTSKDDAIVSIVEDGGATYEVAKKSEINAILFACDSTLFPNTTHPVRGVNEEYDFSKTGN